MIADEVAVGGPVALELHWDGNVLGNMRLRWRAEGEQARVTSEAGKALQAALERYVAGEDVDWPELPVDFEALPKFQRRVLEELRTVPAGETLSYGELAARCGSPKAARAVGQVMAANRWPLVFPCHRVLAAGGRLGGFGPGPEMKRWLLGLEGNGNRR